METISTQASPARAKRPRVTRTVKETPPVSQIDATEARLSTHEEICALRYKALETRMDSIETRMDAISNDVKDLKTTNDKQFSEIKSMLSGAKDEKFKVMITATGTIVVALLGMLGYLVTHLPK